MLYPLILGQAGRGVTFGVGIVLRHPHKIRLGDNVVIDDYCCLDAKGVDNVASTSGHARSSAGTRSSPARTATSSSTRTQTSASMCEIFSSSRVRVGKEGPHRCLYLSCRRRSSDDRTDGPCSIRDAPPAASTSRYHAWLGAHVVVTDGSHMGRDAIVGAGAVVVGDVPEFAIATGIPARVVRDRRT